jgi:eukaryotic-like serine/threonine-protein kinase
MSTGDVIEYLVAHGAYVEAARIAADRGDLRRAIGLLERVWRFGDALPLALQLGDRGLAVRLALDANAAARATEIADAATTPGDLSAVADAFAARGRPFEAARAAERAGDWGRASLLYRRAGAPLDEARVLAQGGELREAGLICERLIAHGSADEATAARIELGRLLGRLGRHEEAVRHLQIAARIPQFRTTALRALCGALLAIGFRGAARQVLARLRQEDGSLPRFPEEVAALEAVESTARDATGITSRRGGGTATAPRRFQIRRLLGGGATGRVYEAVDTLLGIPVALKLLLLGGTGGDLERQAYLRFAREAEAAGRLRHPNIVTLHDAQPAAGLFVFELMAGGTLADRLEAEGPLTPAAGRRMALDLLAALSAAHERGIVHRDVKPANVFFDLAGNAKLGDFGGAHLVDFGQTQTGGFLGTLAYMSPEQITGAPIGFAADLYGLGATLFQALAGRPPFWGPDLVGQHLSEQPPAPTSLRPTLWPAHDVTLLRVLAKSPGERFASAVEMAEAVAAWPIESAPVAHGASDGTVVAAPGSDVSRPESGAAVMEDRELWHTPEARLVRRRDPRTARDVMVQERLQPLDDAALADLRRVAGAGGPHVQRVLRLSEDRRAVWYEAIDGDVQPLGELTGAEHTHIRDALSALPTGAATTFVRTPAGPVVLVIPWPSV